MAETEGDQPSTEGGTSPQDDMNTRLNRKKWYLGNEVTPEVAISVLNASKSTNCFGVYKSLEEEKYMLSAKYKVENASDDLMDHLVIGKGDTGNYKLPGQDRSYEDIVEAVETFVITFEPPLLPALGGASYETQISVADDPPDYDSANRVLKPDIEPLPNITSIRVDSVKEAKTGQISPSSGRSPRNRFLNRGGYQPAPQGRTLPQWRRYRNHHRCHPKNVCHGCCYRERVWNGYRYRPAHKWYDCRGTGPLRLLGLIIYWILCGLCVGCFRCCSLLCTACLYVCCGFYDSS